MTKEKKHKNIKLKGMILKQSWLSVADNTNVRWLRVFHLYKGFNRRSTTVGFFVKGSAQVVEPPRIEYKGFKFKFNRKGDICRGIFIRARKLISRHDGSISMFQENSCVLIKKKQNIKSKYIHGPVPYLLKRKKFKTLFKIVI